MWQRIRKPSLHICVYLRNSLHHSPQITVWHLHIVVTGQAIFVKRSSVLIPSHHFYFSLFSWFSCFSCFPHSDLSNFYIYFCATASTDEKEGSEYGKQWDWLTLSYAFARSMRWLGQRNKWNTALISSFLTHNRSQVKNKNITHITWAYNELVMARRSLVRLAWCCTPSSTWLSFYLLFLNSFVANRTHTMKKWITPPFWITGL